VRIHRCTRLRGDTACSTDMAVRPCCKLCREAHSAALAATSEMMALRSLDMVLAKPATAVALDAGELYRFHLPGTGTSPRGEQGVRVYRFEGGKKKKSQGALLECENARLVQSLRGTLPESRCSFALRNRTLVHVSKQERNQGRHR